MPGQFPAGASSLPKMFSRSRLRRSQSSKSFSNCSIRPLRTLRGTLYKHGVQFHVFVGSLLAVQTGVLEDDPKSLADCMFFDDSDPIHPA